MNLALVPPHHGLDRRSRRARQRAAADRATPHSIEFEQRVLAIGLCPWSSQDTAAPLVLDHGVRPEHFFRAAYRGPWRAIVELVESGTKPSTVLVDGRLTRAEREEIRGVAGLSHLCDGVPRPDAGQLRAYAEGLKALAGRRRRLLELDAMRGRLMDLDDDLQGLSEADTPWRADHPMKGIETLRDDLAILEEPDTPMLVDGFLSLDSTAALVSAPNVGKTHLALTLAASVALNVPVLDRFAVNAPGLVVYVGMEGAAGLKSRLRAMRQAFGVEADRRIGIYFWTDALSLLNDKDVSTLIARLPSPGDIRLIILDTWARLLLPGDENDARDAGMGIAAMDRLRRHTGATVVALHHEVQGGGRERGSTAFRGGLDTLIRIAKRPHGVRRVICDKHRDLPLFEPFEFTLRPVAGSVVPQWAGSVTSDAATSDDPNKDAALMERIRQLQAADPSLSANDTAAKLRVGRKRALDAVRAVNAEREAQACRR